MRQNEAEGGHGLIYGDERSIEVQVRLQTRATFQSVGGQAGWL